MYPEFKMALIRTIQIRLSRDQYDRIKADALASGFYSVSGYLRYLALGRNFFLETKINEIHQMIVGKTKKKPTEITEFPPFVKT